MLIYDPTKPTRLWDGRAQVFSTCRGCGEVMQVISPYDKAHPNCQDKPEHIDVLCSSWIEALCCDEKSKATALKKEIQAIEDAPPELTKAATDFAAWDWPVFPLRPAGCRCTGGDRCKTYCQCPKQPAISKRKGGKGFHDATTDVMRINRWWTKHPTHNIGLATGHSFDVIDIDPRNGGVDSFMELLDTQRLPDIHGVAVTSSGGMHLYIKPRKKGSKPGMLPGIDYKASGGYVVAPPSTLGPRGRAYSWLSMPSPELKSDF